MRAGVSGGGGKQSPSGGESSLSEDESGKRSGEESPEPSQKKSSLLEMIEKYGPKGQHQMLFHGMRDKIMASSRDSSPFSRTFLDQVSRHRVSSFGSVRGCVI